MKSKYKYALMFMIGAFFMLLGCTDVSAATLVQTPIDDVYYTRRGGGKPYMSAQYNTYDMDGKTVYCIEPGVDITVHSYNGEIGWINSPYSKEINQKIQLYGYYGYDYPTHKTMRYRMAAQALIWEETGGQIIEYWTEASGWGDYINVDKEKNEIKRLVEAHYNQPKFEESVKTGVINETISFTDTTGYLSDYIVHQSDGANVSISGNNLLVTPTKVGETTVLLKKKMYTDNPTTIFVGTDLKSQKMGYFGVDDPLYVAVRVNAFGGRVSLEKLDSSTLSFKPVGDGNLKGALYGIYDEYNIRIGELTTTGDSIVTSDYLPKLGVFYLKEEKSSTGYELDPTKYYFEITNSNLNPKITVYEQIIEKEFELYKMFSDGGQSMILKAEPNITFDFYLESSMELYESATTGSDGRLLVTLPYGTFIVRQRNTTPNHEKLEDFRVVINENTEERITKIATNAELTSKLKVVKIDEDSKRIIVRDGIKFKIKNLDTGDYVCQNITYPTQEKICVFETTGGAFITPHVLNSGNYQIEELEEQTIEGYVWNSTPLKFTIADNSKFIYDDEFGVMIEVQFTNKQVKGEFELNKIGEDFKIEDNKFVYIEKTLDNVSFELYADGDIYSQDGTLIYKDKDLVKSFQTQNGKYVITDLFLGKYCLYEKSTDDNHILLDEPYCFEIKFVDQYTEIVKLSHTFKNYLKKADFVFSKLDFSTSEAIPNTTIEIYMETENGDILVGTYITDENGNVVIENMPVIKNTRFYILEKNPAEGYVLNDEKMYFSFNENGEVVKSTMLNEKITSTIKIIKVDEEGNTLAGVKIGIYDLEGNEIGIYTTNELGEIEVELEYNNYMYKELETLEGFVLDENEYYFNVTTDGELIELELINEKITSTIKIIKVDEEGNTLAGVKIGIYDLEGNEIGIYTTNEFGEIEVELEYNSYMYKELEALEGFVLDENEYYFSVTTDGELIELELVNEFIEIEVPNTSSNSYIILIPIAMLASGAVLLFINNKRKKVKNEKNR